MGKLFTALLVLSSFFIFEEEVLAEDKATDLKETDQVIIQMKEDTSNTLKNAEVIVPEQTDVNETVTLPVPKDETVDSFIADLEKREDVESVEPDHLIKLDYVPNDPYYNYFQYHHQTIETENAWDKTMGSSAVVVAVLDNGIDLNHSDLQSQIVSPYDVVKGSYSDITVGEHGTHVAGIIGSSIDNYTYGAGVAPHTSIMPINVFDGEYAYTSDVIQGIYHAISSGADIINMSLGNYSYNYSYDLAIQYAHQNGVVIVAAAGNDSTSNSHYPSSYENVISVGSTDSYDIRSYFSNYGWNIDITAPGSYIYSTVPYNSFSSMSGTSMASPVVAGVAALVMASEPSLSNFEVENRLFTTAEDLGDYGKDYIYGNGRVNARKALMINELPAPNVWSIYDHEESVWGYIPYDVQSAKVTVSNQSGEILGYGEGYSGYSYFTIPIARQKGGTVIKVTVTDQYGNVSETAETTVNDITPPPKPQVDELNDASTKLTGTAEEDSRVVIYQEDGTLVYETLVNGDGTFEMMVTKQLAGTKLILVSTDASGNSSEGVEVIVKDGTAPNTPTVKDVSETTTSVNGTAEAESTITVKTAKATIGSAIANSKGEFTVSIPRQFAGTKLWITATDAAGNISKAKTLTVKDLAAPDAPIVFSLSEKDTSVYGRAEPGSTVKAKVAGTLIGTATADEFGNYTISIAAQKAGVILQITATDTSGNESEISEVLVRDTTTPEISKINLVTDKSTNVTGTAEAEALITVVTGMKSLGQERANEDGSFSVEIPKQKAETKLQLTAEDEAGNVSKVKETIVKDGTAPNIPTVIEVTDASTAVSGTAEANATITIKSGTLILNTGTADVTGKFTISIAKQKAGTKLSVTAMDAAGNVSTAKEVTVKDATAPSVPTVEEISDKTTSITGTAEADSTVTVKAGQTVLGTATTKTDKKYSVTIPKQKAGTVLQITAKDAVGNISSAKEITVIDKTAPSAPSVDEVTENSVAVIGKAEAGSTVTVRTGSTTLGEVVADLTGSYSLKISKQKAGTKFIITATDLAGNISEAKEAVVKDVNAPDILTIDEVTDKSTVLTGTGEVASIITVKADETVLGTATTNANGKYTVTIPKQKAGTKLQIIAEDEAGNRSKPQEIIVKDKTAPSTPSVNEFTDASTILTGTAEANSSITVKIEDLVLSTGTADATGKFTLTIAKQKAETKLSIITTDAAGNKSLAKEVIVKDGTAPSEPVVDDVTDKSTVITGTAEAGSFVTAKAGSTILGTATTALNGKYSITISLQKAGTVIKLSAKDTAGNISNVKETVVKDTTAPIVPIVDEITDASISVTGKAEANSTITIKIENQILKSGITDVDGKYTLTIPKQKAGTKLLISATDAAGNISIAKEVTVKDRTAPNVPIVNEVTDKSVIMTGTAETGSSITVKTGNTVLGTATAIDGEFSITIPKQKAGTILMVTAKDVAGNMSSPFEIIVIDKTAPSVPIVNEVTENSLVISGTAEVESTVTIRAGEKVLGKVTANSRGIYSLNITKQSAGTKLTITATDLSGNISEMLEIIVKDGKAPSIPTVNEVTENSLVISGKAEVGSTVIIKIEETILSEVVADSSGNFSLAISKQKAGTILLITAVDSAGNISEPAEIVVKDLTAPVAPTVDEIGDNSTSITGVAEADATVSIKQGSSVIGKGIATAEGKFSITIAKQKAGTKLLIIATDKTGNISETVEVIVLDNTAPNTPSVNSIYDNATAITGKAETDATIYAAVGNKEIGKAIVVKGVYTMKIGKQKAGTTVSVYALDSAGNKSSSKSIKVIDKTAPAMPSVNVIDDNDVTVTGKAETDAKVYAFAGSKQLGYAIAKKGVYTIKIPKQKARTTVSVYAKDAAGNKSSTKAMKVIDKTAPSVPSVNTIGDNSTGITGKAETSAKVYAYAGKKKLGETTAKKGIYTIKIAKQKVGTSISVYAIDPAKNKSGSKSVKVVDKTAPSAPTVNKITTKSTTVTGKSEKSATILIYNGSKKIGQATVDSKGNFKAKISKQKKGSSIKVYSQDKAKNKSTARTVKVG